MSNHDSTLDALERLVGIIESIERRVQLLERKSKTQRAALLDAFQQIDRLKERADSHYLKICKMEEATRDSASPPTTDAPAVPQEGGEVVLPANYIDPEHQGDDRELLQVFYRACNAEGGTADEIHLRGIRAVLQEGGEAGDLVQGAALVPVPVGERLPEPNTKVLACYFNDLGNKRTICAIWVPAQTRIERYGKDGFTEYDKEADAFYWPEGWYEQIENWEDLDWIRVYKGEVIYWQPLPQWPSCPQPPQSGEVEG